MASGARGTTAKVGAWALRGRVGGGWASVAVLVLAVAAIAGGFALIHASREVITQAPDQREATLRRLEADREARDRRARAQRDERRRRAVEGRAGAAPRSRRPPRQRALRRGSGYDSPAGSRRVRRLQRALRRLDLAPRQVTSRGGQPVRLIVTGQFGPVTERGVRRFQRRTGLPVTGVADAETLDRLYAAARGQGRKR